MSSSDKERISPSRIRGEVQRSAIPITAAVLISVVVNQFSIPVLALCSLAGGGWALHRRYRMCITKRKRGGKR